MIEMKRILSVAVVILSVIVAQAPKGLAQAVTFPTLFDNFSAERIDPARWPIVVARGHEMSVSQEDGRLLIELQANGLVGTGPMPPEPSGRVAIAMAETAAAAARRIQATINVQEFNVTGCGSVDQSRVAARIIAILFRDGANPNPSNPDDQTGVVEAVIQLQAFPFLPPNTLRVSFFADRCGDSICSDALDVDLGSGRFQDVTTGRDVTVGIELDALNNRIIFTKDNETLQTVSYPPTFVVNTDPTQTRPFKAIVVRHRLETCPTRAQGFMSAQFAQFRTKP
jgi:hypothetical protein